MKNMKWAITFIFLMNGIFLSAQNIAIGARGGISIPNLSSSGSEKNPLNTGYSSRLGPEFGVFAEFKISDLFSIEPMVEYSSQGGKKTVCRHFRYLPICRRCSPQVRPRPIYMPITIAKPKLIT